jgi:HlyD family secretion protein
LVYNPASRKLEQREVKTGLANWQYTEISAGLQAGEQVVTSLGRDGVKNGALAKPDETAQP